MDGCIISVDPDKIFSIFIGLQVVLCSWHMVVCNWELLAVGSRVKIQISKILNFRNSNFYTCRMPTKINNFLFKWLKMFR